MRVTPNDIESVSGLLLDLCGIVLDDSKGYLIESRLSELARETECESYADLAHKVRYSGDSSLRMKVIDAVTTNETSFFRDNSPFEALQFKIVPDLADSKKANGRGNRLRIWSAPCSTGQEAYSIAITISETIPNPYSWDINIVGCDVSDAVVSKASAGRFSENEIGRGMHPEMLNKYFNKIETGWQVKDEIRGMTTFERRNLLEPFYNMGPFDVIFCRNVAIYFSAEAREDLFNRLADVLTPDGYLIVGSTESLVDLDPRFAPQYYQRATFYQPNLALVPAGN